MPSSHVVVEPNRPSDTSFFSMKQNLLVKFSITVNLVKSFTGITVSSIG